MQVEKRFSRMQLFVKAAEQFGRLKSKQATKECSNASVVDNHNKNHRPKLLEKWTRTSPRETNAMGPVNKSQHKANESPSQPSTNRNEEVSMLHLLAFNALDLTAPASDVLLRDRRSSWIQLSGHPGSFAPAGPGTIWKKYLEDGNSERRVYEDLMKDIAVDIVPKYYRAVNYQGENFIEMQDLLHEFQDPNVMDIKMGTRTFLESEVSNTTAREDLYDKMVKIDPDAPTAEEHQTKSVTKLRYMTFREQQSSTCSLGFRLEAVKLQGSPPSTDLKTVCTRDEVKSTLSIFLRRNSQAKKQLLHRLQYIRNKFETSPYFQNHEVVGSSILIVYDNNQIGAWIIDFAKTVALPPGTRVSHRNPWVLGNHEEGYLTGLDNLINILEDLGS